MITTTSPDAQELLQLIRHSRELKPTVSIKNLVPQTHTLKPPRNLRPRDRRMRREQGKRWRNPSNTPKPSSGLQRYVWAHPTNSLAIHHLGNHDRVRVKFPRTPQAMLPSTGSSGEE